MACIVNLSLNLMSRRSIRLEREHVNDLPEKNGTQLMNVDNARHLEHLWAVVWTN